VKLGLRSAVAVVLAGAVSAAIGLGGEARRPPTHCAVRVPAKPGLVVRVPADALFEAAPELWGAPGLSLLYGDEGVPFQVQGGEDDRLDPGEAMVFRVAHVNRHSPYLVYTVRRGDPVAAGGGDLPVADAFTAAPFRQAAPSAANPPGFERAAAVDYVAYAPRAWLSALDPLLAHRRRLGHRTLSLALEDVFAFYSAGNPDPAALGRSIGDLRRSTGGRLRFVLLAGDCEASYRPDAGAPPPVPAFYRDKLRYRGMFGGGGGTYPTDEPYAHATSEQAGGTEGPGGSGVQMPVLAVGRIPARSREGLAGFVRKIVAYETQEAAGPWQRRLAMFAGPADYSPFVDGVIEVLALELMDRSVPYDYDVNVTFAKLGSPFAYRFDRLGERLVEDLNAGCLIAVYVGHGSPDSLGRVRFGRRSYSIGDAGRLRRVRIASGRPLFVCFTCHNGAYDRPGGSRCIAELLVMNPDGPVAAFASSRMSHPYGNALYAQAFVAVFLQGRPATVGEGVAALKSDMVRREIVVALPLFKDDPAALKKEHLGLYNLLGDPATRLRYPAPLAVAVRAGGGADAVPVVPAGGQLAVRAHSPALDSGRALVTLEVERRRMLHPLDPIMTDMSEAQLFATLAANHERALDKVVSRKEVPFAEGQMRCTMRAPGRPGAYVVKVLFTARGAAGAGHARFQVTEPTGADGTPPPPAGDP